MRVVSLVPSWTETLIECGTEVVGRTRFCIHPGDRVPRIPVVGGTKDWDWEKIKGLKPDVLLLDREENPKFMAEQKEIPVIDTHVTHVRDLPRELERLSAALSAPALGRLAGRWRLVAGRILPDWDGTSDLPGLIEWGRRPARSGSVEQVQYLIWRKPWMAVSRATFIGSVLESCGLGPLLPDHPVKYPTVELERLNPEHTLLLFSSEPFPFAKVFGGLAELGFSYALVDGEKFSWFGLRSLRFLEAVHGIGSP